MRRPRVLVIDDNIDAADTLAALVVALGGEATTAYNGLDGLRSAEEFRPDVVLLDIGMPQMDGYETCRRLRAQPFGHGYLVAITGFGQLHDRERALAEGFDAHLTKPADPRILEGLFADLPVRRLRSEAGWDGVHICDNVRYPGTHAIRSRTSVRITTALRLSCICECLPKSKA